MRPAAAALMAVALLGATTGTAAATPARSRTQALLSNPRSAVLAALAGIVLIGVGRKALGGLRTRRALRRLSDEDVTPAEVAASAAAGRAAMTELARLHATAAQPEIRRAAARGLLTLWGHDELVAEEEKAIAGRLFDVRWHARRRYPRELSRPIALDVAFGLDGVEPDTAVRPEALQWSYRVVGAHRASLEEFSAWTPGDGRAAWNIEPADFDSAGPHRLVLEPRLRYRGDAGGWELSLPSSAWTLELDPRLAVRAILGNPDESAAGVVAASVQLVSGAGPSSGYRPLDPSFAASDLPALAITAPLPYDLAHQAAIELEGVPSRLPARPVVHRAMSEPGEPRPLAFDPAADSVLARPGSYRMRVILTPDPELAWVEPEIRAIWPGEIVTNWFDIRAVRL